MLRMKSLISNQKLFYLLLVVSAFNFTYCSNETSESDLIIKDNIIYKKGENKPFTGTERAKVKDKIIEYDIVDGIKHGKFRLYFSNGNIAVSGQIDNNKNTGKWQYYYESGSLESGGTFVNDLLDGKWVWYHSSGKLKEEGNYNLGKKIGVWKSFDEKGELLIEEDFSLQETTNKSAETHSK